MSQSQPPQLACPKCGQIDQVQKVSAIVRSATSSGSVQGTTQSTMRGNMRGGAIGAYRGRLGVAFGRSSFSGTTHGTLTASTTAQSDLAHELRPPDEPELEHEEKYTVYALLFGVATFFALIFAVYSFFGTSTTSSSVATGILSGAVSLVIVAPFAVLTWFIWRAHRDIQTRYDAAYDSERAKWRFAMPIWDQLYYCNRDDGVFIPGQSKFVPVAQMTTLLYRT